MLTEANKQWSTRLADERYETLSAMMKAVNSRRMKSRSENLNIGELQLSVSENEGLVLNHKIQPSSPTHWAFGQLATSAGAPAGYLRTLEPELAARCVNASLASLPAEQAMKIMTVDAEGDGPNTLQAVTSATYGRIWDADVLGSVSRIVEQSNGKFFNPKDWSGKPSGLYASDHDIFAFMIDGGSMVDGGGQRDQLNRGFIVWNSEVGSRTFGLMTFLFRVCCGNHLIHDASDVTKLIVRHTSGGPARFDREAMPSLIEYVNASAAPLEAKIKTLKAMPLSALYDNGNVLNDEWMATVSKSRGFSRSELRLGIQFSKAEEGQCVCVWDLINGLTASARSLEFMDARFDLERRAGKLMELAS